MASNRRLPHVVSQNWCINIKYFFSEGRVRVNQRNRFPLNVCRFLLPPRASRQGGGSRKQKAEDVRRKTYTLIYPYLSG